MSATPSVRQTTATSDVISRSLEGDYRIIRQYLAFDLSPYAGATISAATLGLYLADGSGPLDVRVFYHNWGGTLEGGDWAEFASMAAAAGPQAPGGLGLMTFTLGNPQNLLTYGGYLVVALSDEATEPTGENYLTITLGDSTTNKPYIEITYEAGDPEPGVAHQRYIDGTASSSSSSAAVDLSSCSAGELAFVLISRAAAVAPNSVPSGWQPVTDPNLSTYGQWLYYKILEAGDLTTVTWGWASSAKTLAKASIYAGHDPANPIATAAKGSYATGSGSTVDCGSVTTDRPMVVAFCSAYSTSSRSYNALSGWTERRDHGNTSPDFWHLLTDTAGAWGGGECAPDFTLSGTATYRGGFLVAINPVPEEPPEGLSIPIVMNHLRQQRIS
jgi:hypothetical protein